jgi:hypothetical protein
MATPTWDITITEITNASIIIRADLLFSKMSKSYIRLFEDTPVDTQDSLAGN